jgi:hypothetical protein
MKTMKFTLLFAALSMVAQLSLAQVVISDDGTQTADANAVLHLKSDSKGLLLPTISSLSNNWPESSNGMLATHLVDGKTLLYYFNGRELAPGFKVWDVVLTDQSYISTLRDVVRNQDR